MAWPSAYTVNFCNNPRFQNDLSGCTEYGGATIRHDYKGARRVGDSSLWVSCPGDNDGEGVLLASGLCELTGQGCASFYLTGHDVDSHGTLNVVAVDLTTSAQLGSTLVNFDQDGGWTRVVLNNLALVTGHEISVYVETNVPQRCDFNIDCCQWEPQWSYNNHSTPTDYCDGDLHLCDWDGTPDASLSFKLYEIMLSASGNMATVGNGSLLNIGEIFYLTYTDPASGPTEAIGSVTTTATVDMAGFNYVLMVAGLTDFAIFAPGDVDPAISLVGWNNAGISTGTDATGSAGYTRAFATFSAPQLFQGSTGYNVWNQAAYFAVGYEIASMAANEAQNVTHVQTELVPNSGAPTVPTAYVRPRALTATLAPTTMNFITNPGFEAGLASWTALSGTTMTQSATPYLGNHSGEMSGTVTHVGAWINIPDLIVGEVYTASGYVKVSSGVTNMTIAANPVAGFTYAAGDTVAVSGTGWTRVSMQFEAPTSAVNLAFWSTGSGTQTWFLDAVMVSPGGLTAYGDGAFDGWFWESTVNASRSYYYERGNIAYAAVQDVLDNHLPLGVTAYEPIYFTPVTQYS